MQIWRRNILSIQPAAVVEPAALPGAVVLFQNLHARRPDLRHLLEQSVPHLAAYAAAAMWCATKLTGVKPCE